MHAQCSKCLLTTGGFLTPEMRVVRSTCYRIINSIGRGEAIMIGWEGNERTFYRGPKIFKIVPRSEEKMSKSRGAVRIRSESRTKRHSVIKLSRRSVDIINLLRALGLLALITGALLISESINITMLKDGGNSRESRKRSRLRLLCLVFFPSPPPTPLPTRSLSLSSLFDACSKIGVR